MKLTLGALIGLASVIVVLAVLGAFAVIEHGHASRARDGQATLRAQMLVLQKALTRARSQLELTRSSAAARVAAARKAQMQQDGVRITALIEANAKSRKLINQLETQLFNATVGAAPTPATVSNAPDCTVQGFAIKFSGGATCDDAATLLPEYLRGTGGEAGDPYGYCSSNLDQTVGQCDLTVGGSFTWKA
jgi:hypothetical protein